MTEHEAGLNEEDLSAPQNKSAPATIGEESTVGVGSVFAIGCSLIVLVIMLGGVCYFIARQVS